MAFAPGQFITAQRLNRLQNRIYTVEGGTIAAGAGTNVDVPGITQTFTTETNNAIAHCWWLIDFDLGGAVTSSATSRLLLDGSTGSTRFIAWAGEVVTDRGAVTQMQDFTIPTAGSHTIKAQVTTAANQAIGQYCSMRIEVEEVV
jgi:hypothetical protein